MGAEIINHQAVSFMLADMATGIEASRLLTYKSAVEIDEGRPNTLFGQLFNRSCTHVINTPTTSTCTITISYLHLTITITITINISVDG